MSVSLGETVLYTLTSSDAQLIAQRRTVVEGHLGYISGNPVHEGQALPAVVVASFGNGEHVNLKVLLDGYDDYWATSRPEGDTPGTWMRLNLVGGIA